MAISAGSVVALTGHRQCGRRGRIGDHHKTVTSAPATSVGSLASAVKGTFSNSAGKGTFTPQKFSVTHGVLQATGVLKEAQN